MSNDSPPPGEFAPERLEELALETAVKIAAIRSDDAKDILFYMASGFSLQETSRDLRIPEEHLHKRFTKLFNNLELPFTGTHAEQNKQAMWVVQRALQIADDDDAQLQKRAASAAPAHQEPPPAPTVEPEVVLAAPEPEPEPTEEPEAPIEPATAEAEPEPVSEPAVVADEVTVAPEPASDTVTDEQAETEPEPIQAPTLSEVADTELERVMALIRAMPLDTDLRVLAGYTFGGTHKEIGQLLGLTKDQVTKRVHAIRTSFQVPQMSEHGYFGPREFDFLVRAFDGVYPNGLSELTEEGLAA